MLLLTSRFQYAIVMKIRKRKEESLPHWLDYAARKYDSLFIRDMKAVLAIFVLFIPLPVFWSLLVQQVFKNKQIEMIFI